MKIDSTNLEGVLHIKPKVFGDARGFFLETYNKERYMDAGFPDVDFVQDNHSRSGRGVLRGLHFQINNPQGKLVQVVTGSVFDVAVDIRVGSPTFGQWYGSILSEENHHQLWIPPQFAHGFCVLSESADFLYKCTNYYHPDDESGLLWSDPKVAIEWPLKEPLLSAKDQALPCLSDIDTSLLPDY
ncbi:dTDP-4-dehydrorhamnose 3,5-epimerase [hydrothermal vent metagenome]|uniref:dTDP-4-dehydrorhamnose 3,5-epimerase n=1 Tax=hydrothermal vent metagenome TaxID=652676 RepID=A0A3B1A009_9ZZZZ